MRKQLDNLESEWRRNNVIIRRVDEPDHRETWEQCESTVRDKLSFTLGMDKDWIKNIPIERAHRLPKPGRQTEQLRDKPRDIIVKFSFFKDRDVVLEEARTKKPSTKDLIKSVRLIRSTLKYKLTDVRKAGYNHFLAMINWSVWTSKANVTPIHMTPWIRQ